MFIFNPTTSDIDMHVGDTGAFTVTATRASGTAWTTNDLMVFTVKDSHGTVVLQRYYKMTAGTSCDIEIAFANDDTDDWSAGTYYAERRYVVDPTWSGTAPTGNVVNALTASSHITDGTVVRVPEFGQSVITMRSIYGEV